MIHGTSRNDEPANQPPELSVNNSRGNWRRGPRTTSKPISAPNGLITILFSATVKTDREQEFALLARQLTESTRAEDEGCVAYVFLQQTDNPREYVLYEQWRDRAALDAHLGRLQRIFGRSSSVRGLPPALLDFFETTRIVRYRPIG